MFFEPCLEPLLVSPTLLLRHPRHSYTTLFGDVSDVSDFFGFRLMSFIFVPVVFVDAFSPAFFSDFDITSAFVSLYFRLSHTSLYIYTPSSSPTSHGYASVPALHMP